MQAFVIQEAQNGNTFAPLGVLPVLEFFADRSTKRFPKTPTSPPYGSGMPCCFGKAFTALQPNKGGNFSGGTQFEQWAGSKKGVEHLF